MNYEEPTGHARGTDPDTSHAGARGVDGRHLRAAVANVIIMAGAEGATWDEVCEALPLTRPGSLSPRLRELRKQGVIRIKTGPGGVAISRTGETGFEQNVYVIREDTEPLDVVESSLDDYLNPDTHGADCLHCQLRTAVDKFCTEHPDIYVDEILAAVAGVVGDYLADDASQPHLGADIRNLKDWVRQRITFVRQGRIAGDIKAKES